MPMIDAHAQGVASNSIEEIAVIQQGGILNLRLAFKEPLVDMPSAFVLSNPSRMVFDFVNTTNNLDKSNHVYNEGDLRNVNIIQTDDRTRVVLNLNRAMTYEYRQEGNNLLLALTPSIKIEPWQDRVEHFSQARPFSIENNIRDIAFRRGREGEARIIVYLSDPNTGIDISKSGQDLIIDFAKIKLPVTLSRRLDVTDFATPVLSFNTLQRGENTRMTISSRGLWEYNAYQMDDQFVIEVVPIQEDPNRLVQGTRGGWQGERLSLNFQNVEVRRLLQVIGEFTGLNIVVSDSVGGSITLILRDVPWDQALDIIMRQKGLDMRKNGNVVLIAPREELATKERLELEAKNQISDLEPLIQETFQLNYVRGEELQRMFLNPRMTPLSRRGRAMVDARTNILIVNDVPSRIEDLRAMIKRIDIPVRQVLIEARIVEAGDTFARNLGMRLATGRPDSAGGNLTTTFSPDTGPLTGGRWPLSTGFGQVNLPSGAVRGAAAATYSLAFFSPGLSRFIAAEISAMEADGRGKVISSPRVMTANQVEAVIEQGTEIPYQQATTAGATSVAFRKANLALRVRPQITPDGRISMALSVNKDTPNTTIATAAGLAIDTKHVKTEVLVDNGGTVVIGGIYTQEIRTNTQRVPFFGDLPFIGWLFKHRSWIDDKTELLIFITPRIVTDGVALR